MDSIVYGWLGGLSPESIVDSYPVLTLEEVHGALAYYLAHQQEIDEYLVRSEAEFEELRQQMTQKLRETKPLLYSKLVEQKQRRTTLSS